MIIIQFLGKINIWLFPYKERYTIPNRLCYSEYEDAGGNLGMVTHISCCDCGASHYYWKANRGIYGIPIRPDGYNYHWRIEKKDKPSLADTDARSKWNINR